MKKLSVTSRFVIITVSVTVVVILLLLTLYRSIGITSQFIPVNDIKIMLGLYDPYDYYLTSEDYEDEPYYEETTTHYVDPYDEKYSKFGEFDVFADVIPESEPTTAFTVGWFVVSTEGDDLNLRELPTTDSDIMGRIPNKTEILVTDITDGWAKTQYNGVDGYVSADFIIEKT